jgi:hypothetical protein
MYHKIVFLSFNNYLKLTRVEFAEDAKKSY